MRWGVRRFQNEDGSLTSAGQKRAKQIESSRKEGVDYANKLAADRKKGISAANALVSAQRKAKETGVVDSDFLNNPNISQKAKNKVTNIANQRVNKEQKKINFPLISAYEKGAKVFGAIAGAGVLMGLTSTALDLKGLTSSSVGRTKVSNALMTIGGLALLSGTVAGTAVAVSSGVKNLKLRKENYKED